MSSELSYSSIKLSHQIREHEDKKAKEKKRQILYLVQHFLKTEGYSHTVRAFTAEAQLTNQYEVCDNVDLPIIVQDFESYYNMRFAKYPKICKKTTAPPDEKEPSSFAARREKKNAQSDHAQKTETEQPREAKPTSPQKSSSLNGKLETSYPSKDYNRLNSLQNIDLTVLPLALSQPSCVNKRCADKEQSVDNFSERILKPLGGYVGFTGEWRELAEMISKEICMTDLNVRWTDIMGLDEAKRLLKEAVVYPTKYPELFSGVLAPWRGLLLYGPPGTGKTLLAKAVATECHTTFFNISASTIVSKWRGDSEKLVRVMFELARYHAPSTIFLDEMDALASHRDGAEHEASRRLKTELLIQLDGLAHSEDRVFLLAASNLPWELDAAMLRRLEKRILVDLPNTAAREAMIRHHLPPLVVRQPALRSDIDYPSLAHDTDGYSGSDIKLVCKEAAMAALRAVFSVLEAHQDDTKLPSLALKTITTHDLQEALSKTKPSAVHLVSKYQKWQKEFGSM